MVMGPSCGLVIADLGKRFDPPSIGQDGRDLLAEFGYRASEIDALLARGVIALS